MTFFDDEDDIRPDEEAWLFDDGAPPPHDVANLMDALAPLAYRGPAPAPPRRWGRPVAALLLLAVGLYFILSAGGDDAPKRTGIAAFGEGTWGVETLDGSPTINGAAVEGEGGLPVDGWLETDAHSRARLTVADIGEIEVSPRSRIRLVGTGEEQHRVELAVGTIHARVDAPPELFWLDTPSATAIDLGCEYELKVDQDGNGTLVVRAGEVQLEGTERGVSTVVVGATCEMRADGTVGTPYFIRVDNKRFRQVLERVDFESGLASNLDVLLREAVTQDTLSLWHLLKSTGDFRLRQRIYERMYELVPHDNQVQRAKVLALDTAALDAWWDQLYWTWR